MIDIAIVDDDPNFLEELSQRVDTYLKERPMLFSVHAFASGAELLKCTQDFDLIFLDIQMDGISGMETAKKIRADGTTGHIVFITVLSEYIYDAFDVEASDYLLKPIDKQRFERMMNRICSNLQNKRKPCLLITFRGNGCRFVFFEDIFYCEAANHKMVIHTKDTVHECYFKTAELKSRLDGRFFQCHRSYLINLKHVCGYENGLALLESGEKVPVSRLRAREFSQRLLQYMKECVS